MSANAEENHDNDEHDGDAQETEEEEDDDDDEDEADEEDEEDESNSSSTSKGDGAEGEGAVDEGEEALALRKGIYNAEEVNDQVFEELVLGQAMAAEIQGTWAAFMQAAESREAAGEAIYAALFDSAPSLQSLFKTPRAVMAMRFMTGLNQIISNVGNPQALKVVVETLGFQHLELEVTVPRVQIFRDAIIDLLMVELGPTMTERMHMGWAIVLNYVGGAYMFVRIKFADRLRILTSSWAMANNRNAKHEDEDVEESVGFSGEREQSDERTFLRGDKRTANAQSGKQLPRKGNRGSASDVSSNSSGNDDNGFRTFKNTAVPSTYKEMFVFNAAVMGFGGNSWMNEVLFSFDTIVLNVSNSYRLQEECDVLSLRLAKHRGPINLGEYKAVMMASLRSLCPKDWNSNHEVAWLWLWENVERMLKSMMGKPALQERALGKVWSSLDEEAQAYLRREIYTKFFTLAPAGQDYFKQSTTRLHFIADRIVAMTLEMFKEPQRLVEDISALGLRHVGYGIPTDLFGPFVTACVQAVRSLTQDDLAEEAFRWSLSLISRILTRVITEGSTIVMRAINTNSAKQLRKAVACAPRGKRASWMLNIQVGTQSISPFLWAVEAGSLEAAKAILQDLLTIRADRDRYYFGADALFERHPDLIKRLSVDAPALLPALFNGLVWRSRTTENGMRRVNYYIKHLLVDSSGGFAKSIEWLAESGDPNIVCHPVVAMVTDLVWSNIAFRTFLNSKLWVVLTLMLFAVGINARHHLPDNETSHIIALACRGFIYVFNFGYLAHFHSKRLCADLRSRQFRKIGCLRVPAYLLSLEDIASFLQVLCLAVMICTEPVLHCMQHRDGGSTSDLAWRCPEAEDAFSAFSVAAALAMLTYFALSLDLSVFSTSVSAWTLVCCRVLPELALSLFGLLGLTCAFASSLAALNQDNEDFSGVHMSALSMIRIAFGMYGGDGFERLLESPALLIGVVGYVLCAVMFVGNLLVAQLSCAYASTYKDMVGYARLNRGKVVTEAMAVVPEQRWQRFMDSLHLDHRIEFLQGDIGLAGGVQVLEPASANVTTLDTIRRFGGSTSPQAQWPEDDSKHEDEGDRLERLEKVIMKLAKKSQGRGSGGAGEKSSLSGTMSSIGVSGLKTGISDGSVHSSASE